MPKYLAGGLEASAESERGDCGPTGEEIRSEYG